MPSARDCADRLREHAYKTLLPQIQDLEEELRQVSSMLSTGVHQIERKLEALRHIELPATELVLDEVLGDVIQRRDLEAGSLARFARELRQKETQEEILTYLLDNAVQYFPRIALFTVRGEQFIGWSSRGFSEGAARSIGSDSFARTEYPQFQEALNGADPITITDLPESDSFLSIHKDSLGPWQLFPLYVLQRPVALLLAAGAEGIACRPEALSLLMDFTAQRLENVALKLLYELNIGNSEFAAPAMRTETIPAPMSGAEPATIEEAALEAPLATEPAPIEEPIPSETGSALDMESVQEEKNDLSAEPSGGHGFNDWTANGYNTSTSNPATEASSVLPEASLPVPEEEKLHTDAKRFARLLVSEIKLYNENPVAEGRQNGDLYLRLKRDIDRSREMYEKRISPIVARKIDYFHDEILRILGDNDPSTLGNDYPGPRIES